MTFLLVYIKKELLKDLVNLLMMDLVLFSFFETEFHVAWIADAGLELLILLCLPSKLLEDVHQCA